MSAEVLSELEELERLVGSRRRGAIFSSGEVIWTTTSILGSVTRNDWRPVWEKAREIQSLFNTKPHFPTHADRDAAWARFNALRDEAGSVSKEEFADLCAMSDFYRGNLMSDLRYLNYDPSAFNFMDAILGSETAEDMKRRGAELNAVAKRFSELKHKLIKEHKQEIFDRIGEIRASHNVFWGQRNDAYERKKEQGAAKRSDFESRVLQNVAENRERLAKAESALERCAENISSNYAKLSEAKSESFADEIRRWISNDEDRLDDIKASIARIRGWIADGEAKLR